MGFDTMDLGRVIQTAESIKSMRRQAETDKIRDAYLQTNIAGAQQGQQFAAQDQQAQMDATTARMHYFQSHAIESAANPIEAVKQLAPELIEKYDAAHGAGSFDLLHVSEVKALASYAKKRAAAVAGIVPYEDSDAARAQQAQQGFAEKQQGAQFGQQKQLAEIQHGYRMQEEGARGTDHAGQLVTRPIGDGTVQDYLLDTRTGERRATGTPYRPVTPQTGNVTEGERKAAALGTRLESALQALDGIETTAPGASRPGVMERGLEGVGMETAANMVRGSDRQQADGAQLDALDAALTLATGAAYTREQLQNLRKSYFPQIGDSDENVAAKRQRFETIVKTARIAAGRAEPSIDAALGSGSQSRSATNSEREVRVSSPQEAMSLPPGTVFITPDGRRKVR